MLSTVSIEIEKEIEGVSAITRILASLGEIQEYIEIDKLLSEYSKDIEVEEDSEVVLDEFEEKYAELVNTFLSFAKNDSRNFQVSYIDETGQEIVKVERENQFGNLNVVKPNLLQNKSDQPYFKNSITLASGEVYVSEMDLNIESGEIEVPYLSIIRFASPVFDDEGVNHGIVLINFFSDSLVGLVRESPLTNTVLVDQEGYYLYNLLEPEKEWSKSLGTNYRFPTFEEQSTRYHNLFLINNFVKTNEHSENKYLMQKVSYNEIDSNKYWILIKIIEGRELVRGFDDLGQFILLINAVIVSGVAILFVLFVYFVTRPWRYILKAIEKIKEGDYSYKIPVFGNDEYGILSKGLNSLMKSVAENEKERYEFISSASHQLRTPSSALRMQIELLRSELKKIKAPKRVLYFLDDIFNQNDRAVVVMNDMLKYIEIGSSYVASDHKVVKVLQYIEEVVAGFFENIKEKKLKIIFDIDDQVTMRIEESRFKYAINNILSNAIDYSKPKGEIKISVTKEKNQLRFIISDKGIGIPKQEQGSIFEKFFRATNSYEMKSVGSGLGLVIAQRIIQGHGGKITINSAKDKGTIVNFTISN